MPEGITKAKKNEVEILHVYDVAGRDIRVEWYDWAGALNLPSDFGGLLSQVAHKVAAEVATEHTWQTLKQIEDEIWDVFAKHRRQLKRPKPGARRVAKSRSALSRRH